jgi:D-alanyl-D-alanine carboxypeptidase/D-alanyl-D-alanine-endopeptidase (penicillin-binding protein 4)
MRSKFLAIFALTLCANPSPARAYVPERTPQRNVQAAAHAVLERPESRTAFPALMIVRGDATLFSLNATVPMLPASLMKLLTTTAAMVKFGADHRFVTRALILGDTLYLVGGADPTIATAAYRRARFFPKPTDRIKLPAFASGSPTYEDLAARIAGAGARDIGRIVCDATLFDDEGFPPGWPSSYLATPSPESGSLSALTVNEGFANPKQTAMLPQPSLAAGDALRAALIARGVRVRAAPVSGRAPARAREIARVQSPPLSEIVGFTNRYSINFDAEMLLKSLGARFGGAGTTAGGVRVVRATLESLRIPLDGLSMADGSGLSLHNRVQARTLAALLRKIVSAAGPDWDAMRASLPVAGGPGTLDRRMKSVPTGGNLRAKTGSINHVRGMAGWVTASDGIPIVFVALYNRAPFIVPLARPLDLLGLLLARFPGF